MMNKKLLVFSICLCTALSLIFIFSCNRFRNADLLKDGFINPPDSAKPGVYWYIMDGNLDRRSITGDLESMKKAGIGYALFLEVNVGIPRGKVDFLSEEWQDLFTYAVREAERLGIRIILGSGPGWAGSGGPWVKPEQSMMHLVASDTLLTGPLVIDMIMPRPKPRKPFFGDESLTPELKEIRNKWFEDVRVLAFPSPEKKSAIENIDEKAFFTRAPYTSQPGVAPFIISKAEWDEVPHSSVSKERIIDISNNLDSTGRIKWIVPPGKWIIMRLGKTNNGAVTRPAPLPGLGFESDKFDTSAFRAHFEAYTGKLIKKVRPVKSITGGGWTMIHIDSWEMGAQNWSNRFMEQFIKRRGYDPILYLPVMEGYIVNSVKESERFLWDIRETASELIVENHAEFFKKLGRKYGMTLSIEPYDMNPSADLDLGTVADVPMGEFWSEGYGFNSSFSIIEATSAAHVAGKPIVAAEAFTAGANEAWKKYPGNMKNQTDWALAMGINRFIIHTFVHKSFIEGYRPGMTMGPYGVHWDRGQTWWPMVNDYHRYLQRCQFVLSQGRAVSDFLFLTPEGAPNVFRPPVSALEGTDTLPDKKSYSFDGCSPAYFIKYANVQDSRIVFPGGASYRFLILPDIQTMTPELLSKIDLLVKGGITVMGNPPKKSPSLSNYPACDDIVRNLTESIWKAGPAIRATKLQTIKHGGGLLVITDTKTKQDVKVNPYDIYPSYDLIETSLINLKVKKDFVSSGDFRYCHRSFADKDVYFVSNRTGGTAEDSCTFRDGSYRAERWDPLTGEIKQLKSISKNPDGYSIKIRLETWQSIFIVFYHTRELTGTGRINGNNFPEKKPVYTLRTSWTVKFDTTMGGPEKVIFDSLPDWKENKTDGIKYYSGIATYSCNFTLPDSISSRKGRALYLDLGSVKDIARVILNGRDLGVVWTFPFQVRINNIVKQKNNHLEIEVANLWINRLIGDEQKPWDGIENGQWPEWLIKGLPRTSGRYTFTTHRFYTKDDPLAESGLLGPVRILRSEE
jgi:alpha-L-rhamnosidase